MRWRGANAAFFHLYRPSDAGGDWVPTRKADGCPYDETPEQLAELKKSFPNPRDAVDCIMDTFPIVKRKDEAKYGSYVTRWAQAYKDKRCFHPGASREDAFLYGQKAVNLLMKGCKSRLGSAGRRE